MAENYENELAQKYPINLATFSRRLQALYSHWREHKDELWGSADFLSIATPPRSDDLRYLTSSTLNIWLLGCEYSEAIMVFGTKQIHILCNPVEAYILNEVKKSAKDAVRVDVIVHVKPKVKKDDGTVLLDELLDAMRSEEKSEVGSGPTVGYIVSETPLLGIWVDKLKSSGLLLCDVANGFSDLFAVKDREEITFIKKSAYLTASVMRHFVVPNLEKVIDEGESVTHSSLTDATERAILEPAKVGVELEPEKNVDICYPPIFQSGGIFDLRPTALSNEDGLFYETSSVIISALGSRYKSYCSNIARTILIDANTVQRKTYEVLLRAQEAAIGALHPGIQASAVYEAAVAVVQRDAPELLPNLTKSAGSGIGILFRESRLLLNAKNNQLLKAGMAFNVSLGFQNLQNNSENPKSRNFALLLADTVVITDVGHVVMTHMCSKDVKDVCYSFVEEVDELARQMRMKELRMQHEAGLAVQKKKEKLRRLHQNVLALQNIEETERRLYGRDEVAGTSRTHSQEKLVLAGNKIRPVRLSDLWIRSVSGGHEKKLSGNLKAYANGFRYTTSRPGETVDIMYGNIKHAFYQPAEEEMITLFHLHLHNRIKVGNNKTKDVQFYVEVMDMVPKSAYDSDDMEEDQKETDFNCKIMNFVEGVHDIWRQQGVGLEFEQPLRKLGFPGVPFEASSFIMPTSNCLVELIETPFLVITLSEIEIVNLERVGIGQRSFDLAVVYKNFKKPVTKINLVPDSELDKVEDWLDNADIKYYKTRLNLNWPILLNCIDEDPGKFLDEGGWEFLNLEGSDSEFEHSDMEDQDHEPSGAELVQEEMEEEEESREEEEEPEDEIEKEFRSCSLASGGKRKRQHEEN